ncbi:ATP-dependent nuclease [Pseudomonas sp. BGr12]|uniref:ATP-dependent nuclease n=1 Tax=Pseudomonas sp. BGr12 TaxID=2936269 RepID=UPI00255A0D8A|nr:AAA family ATPase [Pseudomonas sp. BJa5]MDL2430994.1 ATP-binding protein [Pseudomonas sp. BJa5]
MKYRNSQTDISLRKWFSNDYSHAHLRNIEISHGSIRGLTSCSIPIDFPIMAIAGKNGSGKSTTLALACCAYHNSKDGFKANNRKQSYYTFADFFVQHKNEGLSKTIHIKYFFAHDNWRTSPESPEKKAIKYQFRYKSQGGKWNEYASRIKRNAVFIGIERIVPHSEKSQSKSYCRYFTTGEPKGWEESLGEIVGYILNKKYEEIKIASHSKYKLPLAKVNGVTFSGFNMGAGENALFEIFSTIYSSPEGSLIVIDEIELGLHIEAQARFIRKLKEICLERKTQIICTTHSSEIFDYLPEDARVFIEKVSNKTIATTGYSSSYAFSKLSAENSKELCILVEDDVAQKLITLALPNELRSRVNTEIIGSASALSVQLASSFKISDSKTTIALFDGDQKSKEKANCTFAQNTLEIKDEKFKEWFSANISYLPGDNWPEAWILESSKQSIDNLSETFKIDAEALLDIIEYGLQAGKHNEFFEIGKHLNLPRDEVLYLFCLNIAQYHIANLEDIINLIRNQLEQ